MSIALRAHMCVCACTWVFKRARSLDQSTGERGWQNNDLSSVSSASLALCGDVFSTFFHLRHSPPSLLYSPHHSCSSLSLFLSPQSRNDSSLLPLISHIPPLLHLFFILTPSTVILYFSTYFLCQIAFLFPFSKILFSCNPFHPQL